MHSDEGKGRGVKGIKTNLANIARAEPNHKSQLELDLRVLVERKIITVIHQKAVVGNGSSICANRSKFEHEECLGRKLDRTNAT